MESGHHVGELVGTIVGLLLIASGTLAFSKRFKLPFSVMLVLVGIAFSQLAEFGPAFLQSVVGFDISPDVILFVFLPTLIFESAFHIDLRQLKSNLLPVLTLAVPGLILSTVLIGLVVGFFTPIDYAAALLLGAILSATDPVAVISLFKQLGAPKRLTILVEGESLFNDATSIVVARILMGVVAAGFFTTFTYLDGIKAFVVVFLGGVLVGWLAGLIIGFILGKVEGDPFIEISLTTILAYFSFLIAEEYFHVSGVMATVAAGITMGNWGRTKISPSVSGYMEHFWEYLAYVANALIFLLVGLRVELDALWNSLDLLGWVVLAMLLSRAVVVYGLVPLAGRLPGVEPVNRSYQSVMFWGGLRGAIALAIVLSLKDFEYAETFIALVMGAVLFTLLVQGLTIEKLVRWLGLDQPPLTDRVAQAEGLLASKVHALERIPELQAGGLFSARIAKQLSGQCEEDIGRFHSVLKELRSSELDREQERILLFVRCFAVEKNFYYDLFSKGHLSEQAYRDLCHSIDLQVEAVRLGSPMPPYTLHPPEGDPIRRFLYRLLETLFGFSRIPERLRIVHVARDYEEAWGRYQSCVNILAQRAQEAQLDPAPPEIVREIEEFYQHWLQAARERIDDTAAQFPEFTNAMQERLAYRLVVHAQKEVIESETRAGTIPSGVADKILAELAGMILELRGRDLVHFQVDPSELLRKVPSFRAMPPAEFGQVTDKLQQRTVTAGEIIIRQGGEGDSLYLIARGVVRVSVRGREGERDLATLMAGDFFGEMALLHKEPRTATCRAVTPCALYELRRDDFEKLCVVYPAIRDALEDADRERGKELYGS